MSYWNPTQNRPYNPNQRFINDPSAATQGIYNQNYNAVGNQLMGQVAGENAWINEQSKLAGTATDLANQAIDLRTQNQAAKDTAQAQIDAIRLGGIPAEKAWRNRLKQLAEGTYNVQMRAAETHRQAAHETYNTNLRDLYSGAVTKGGGVGGPGVRKGRMGLYNQLQLQMQQVGQEKAGAKLDLQTAYANYTHYIQQLDQDARIYGIDRDSLMNGMQNALKQAGLDKQVNLAQLAADRKSNDIKIADNANTVWEQLRIYAMSHPEQFEPTPAQRPSASLGHGVF